MYIQVILFHPGAYVARVQMTEHMQKGGIGQTDLHECSRNPNHARAKNCSHLEM